MRAYLEALVLWNALAVLGRLKFARSLSRQRIIVASLMSSQQASAAHAEYLSTQSRVATTGSQLRGTREPLFVLEPHAALRLQLTKRLPGIFASNMIISTLGAFRPFLPRQICLQTGGSWKLSITLSWCIVSKRAHFFPHWKYSKIS